jgi:hypothetical protein
LHSFDYRLQALMVHCVLPNACREWDPQTEIVWSGPVQTLLEVHRRDLFQVSIHMRFTSIHMHFMSILMLNNETFAVFPDPR